MTANYGMNKSKAEVFSFDRPIVLIGMMGAGKTSIGRALAELTGLGYKDSDAEIEIAAGCRVSDIFERYGESEFRRMERKVIERLLYGGACVLSLGGGAFINDETRQKVKEKAISIWIRVDRELLFGRVTRHGDRPLLKGGDAREKLWSILDAREPIYAQADLVVDCDDSPVAQNAKHVLEEIRKFRAQPTK